MRYLTGDFVTVADGVEPADLVALDRVICCYADVTALIARSAPLARFRYGLVYPRDTWLARLGVTVENLWLRFRRSSFRVYFHRTTDVDAIVAAHGLVKRHHRQTLGWQLSLYERPTA